MSIHNRYTVVMMSSECRFSIVLLSLKCRLLRHTLFYLILIGSQIPPGAKSPLTSVPWSRIYDRIGVVVGERLRPKYKNFIFEKTALREEDEKKEESKT